ncbi:MAG: class I SAM-dependent methyltransferase [Alphaproteobacteria bacterium]|nr:class I SAM-dependent methyltransferase [Alphaproteobacteria bacterium]
MILSPYFGAVIFRCLDCGFTQTEPVAEEVMRRYYTAKYVKADEPEMIWQRQQFARVQTGLVLERFRPSPGSRALDYGSAGYELPRQLAAHFAEVVACDIAGGADPGVPGIRLTSIEDVDRERPFDLVVLSHVLEHVADPFALLTRIHEMLVMDGVLYLEVPNEAEHVKIGLMGKGHVWFFDPHTLRAFVERHGGFDFTFLRTDGASVDEYAKAVVEKNCAIFDFERVGSPDGVWIRAFLRKRAGRPVRSRLTTDAESLLRQLSSTLYFCNERRNGRA